MTDIFNLGKQLDSLVASFFNAIEKYDELKTRRRKDKKQLAFGKAQAALFGVHHTPGYFGELLTGHTTICDEHHKMAKDEAAMIEKHRKAIHAAVAEFDIHIAAQLDKILRTKVKIYDRIADEYDKIDKDKAEELGHRINYAYDKLTESICKMQEAIHSGKL
jgi:gamma-glutamylcyclotransferase (GGCT)/AIG2-like uncharacterized protein YtfP